uniref:L1 transposable element RRM domain-containing protein n=1 Tax=Latimeria chalumnae TaxID=7897 RepID=H3A4B9_LATCH
SSIKEQTSLINHKVDAIDQHFEEAETRISTLEDHEEENIKKMANMEAKLCKAWERLEDLENRSRCNNICIMGLQKGVEDRKPIKFLKKNLPNLLGMPEEEEIKIEKVHRSLAPRPKLTQQPCPIIMRLLKFQTRELILKKAQEKQEVSWENHRLTFFQDLSKEVHQKRKLFWEAKQQLRRFGIKYYMACLAALKIHRNGILHSFSTPVEVLAFIKKIDVGSRMRERE